MKLWCMRWLLFGLLLLFFDITRGMIGPGSSILFVYKQRGLLIAIFWGAGIVLGSLGLFVVLIFTPTSVIRRLPNFGPRHTGAD